MRSRQSGSGFCLFWSPKRQSNIDGAGEGGAALHLSSRLLRCASSSRRDGRRVVDEDHGARRAVLQLTAMNALPATGVAAARNECCSPQQLQRALSSELLAQLEPADVVGAALRRSRSNARPP